MHLWMSCAAAAPVSANATGTSSQNRCFIAFFDLEFVTNVKVPDAQTHVHRTRARTAVGIGEALGLLRDFDRQIGIEPGVLVGAVYRVTARIADDAGAVDDVVEAVVRVAMDPQMDALGVEQSFNIRNEAPVQQRAAKPWMNAPRGRGVMRDDDGRPDERFPKRVAKKTGMHGEARRGIG